MIKFTQDKFVELLNPKDRQRYLAMATDASPNDVAEAEEGLSVWERTMRSTVPSASVKSIQREVPAVRGSKCFQEIRRLASATSVNDDTLYYNALSSSQNSKLRELRFKLGVSAKSESVLKSKASE